jgi:hypothetical protein
MPAVQPGVAQPAVAMVAVVDAGTVMHNRRRGDGAGRGGTEGQDPQDGCAAEHEPTRGSHGSLIGTSLPTL